MESKRRERKNEAKNQKRREQKLKILQTFISMAPKKIERKVKKGERD